MTDDPLIDAAREHIALFNACVDSGDWAPFVATYHRDAVLEIVGAGIPAIRGRDAIAAFYTARPPREHLRADTITTSGGDTTEVDFAWDSGGRGTLTARWDGRAVTQVRLTPQS